MVSQEVKNMSSGWKLPLPHQFFIEPNISRVGQVLETTYHIVGRGRGTSTLVTNERVHV